MTAKTRPNVVVIMSDDQGHGDLSYLGSPDIRTPHLDALAESGVRLNTFYSNSPVCSPSRASLLTGRVPARAGVRSIIDGHRWAPGLPGGVPTLPEILRRCAGYRTSLVGKWHLGVAEGSRPQDHGFDDFFGFLGGTIDYFSHINYGMNNRTIHVDGEDRVGTPVHDLWSGDAEVWKDGEYMTEVIGRHAEERLRELAVDEAPFYLHVAFNAPHYPLHAPERYRARFDHLPPERAIVAAMISAMDDQIGRITATLDDLGIRDETIVFFMSDNGPSREIRNWLDGSQDAFYGSTTGGLKGHKFSLFDGGIRVPGILSWPRHLESGMAIDDPVAAMDIAPTVLGILGIDPASYEMDGQDLRDAFAGNGLARRDLFWEQGEQTAMRRGRWKLVLNGRLVEEEGVVDEVHLADLEEDPGEQINLAAERPDLVTSMTKAAERWREDVEAYWGEHWLPALGTDTSFARPSFHR